MLTLKKQRALTVLLTGTDGLYQSFYEGPDRRLQPLVVKDAHIQRLMPVGHGDAADAGAFRQAGFGNQRDAHTGSHKLQRALYGVDGADHR